MPLRSLLFLLSCVFSTLFLFASAPSVRAETFRNPLRIPLPVDPYGVTAGDLNGDGKTDIVWTELPAYPATTSLHVLLAGTGGQYTPASILSVPFLPVTFQCKIEDVTGDRKNDLVCLGNSIDYIHSYLLTYPGNGDGTFAAPVQTEVITQPLLYGPILAPAGDLNGDGFADVLVMAAYYNGILPYLSDGKGGFTKGQLFQGSFNFSTPVVTDLNGDGKLDVLWPTGPRVNLGHGDGTFSPNVQYDPGFDSNCAFGDVDGDGHLDAACTWPDSSDLNGKVHLTVLHGNPDGSFAAAPVFTRTFGTGENTYDGVGTILSPVLITDLNGDGYADIIALSGDGYCVLLGGPNATWNGQPHQFVTASFQSEYGLSGLYGVSIKDMNGDGLPDLVAIGPNGIYITYAQKDGTLSAAPAPEVGQVSTSVTLADFNGDGNLDAVSAGDTALKLSLGVGDGTFSLPQPVTTTGNFNYGIYIHPEVFSGDFNGDGKQDLLATGSLDAITGQTYLLLGHGDGTFATPLPVSIPASQTADLNNDGRSDVYSIHNDPSAVNTLVVSLSNGNGTFSTASTNLPVENAIGYTMTTSGPAFSDYRHSGRLDAVVANLHNAYLLQSHGDGTFDTTGTTLVLPDLPNLNKFATPDVTSGDFDGDGNPDVAVLVQYGPGLYNLNTAVWVFYGNGHGSFSPGVLAGVFNRSAQTLRAGDLNGDGLADLVLTSYDLAEANGVLIVHALPNRTWGPEVDYTGGDGLTPFWIADLNHDGRNDLIFSGAQRFIHAASSISILLNQPPSTFTGTLLASPEPSFVSNPFSIQATLVPPVAGVVLSGTVTFSLDGNVVGNAPLSGNVSTLSLAAAGVTAGSHTLTASWPGDASNPPLNLSATHAVLRNPVKLSVTSSANPGLAGQTITFAIQVSAAVPPTPAGPLASFPATLSLYDGATLLATQTSSSGTYTVAAPGLASGAHTITASYAGDDVFAAGQATLNQVVTGLPVSMQLSSTANPVNVGTTTSITARITSSAACPGCLFTAPVQFTDGGVSLRSAPVNASGFATLTISFTSAGPHTLAATYPGDSHYASASASLQEQVLRADTSLTLTHSASPVAAGTPVSFTARLSASGVTIPLTGAVLVFTDGINPLGTIPVDTTGSATVTSSNLSVGTHTITATFAQTASLNGSSASVAEIITQAPTLITLTGSPNPVYQNSPLTLTVALSTPAAFPATGTVQLLDGGSLLKQSTISANAATFVTSALTPGTHSLSAVFAGDPASLPATSAPLLVTVLASDFVLTSTPSTLSIKTQHHLTFTLNTASVGNFKDQLVLTSANLPGHMTVRFNTSRIDLASAASGAVSVYMDTDDVIGYASMKPSARPDTHQPSVWWAFAPAPFLLLFLRRRAKRWSGLCAILLACAVIPLAGCSSLYPKSVAPGTYTIQLQAVGENTGLSHTLLLTVTVTP